MDHQRAGSRKKLAAAGYYQQKACPSSGGGFSGVRPLEHNQRGAVMG
jgi:hypothetical protein